MGLVWRSGVGALILGAAASGCGESGGHPPAPATPWLELCDSDADCGSTAECLCGRCTVACADSCGGGPEGTTCTRLSSCGTTEAGACLLRCVRNSDCREGLECWFGLCTNDPSAELNADSDVDETFPGTHHPGSGGTWARTMVGILMASPRILLGPGGDLIAKVTSERVPIESPRFNTDDWLIRFDGTTGAMQWVEEMPDYSSFAVDGSGNIVLAWPTLLQKLDPAGSLLWAKAREPRAPYERANVAVDGDGNILIARVGLTESPGTVGGDHSGTLELQKLDPDGDELWSKRFGNESTMLDDPYLVADASNDIVLIASTVKGPVDFGGGLHDDNNVLAKFTPDGEHVFSKSIGGYGLTYYAGTRPIQTTPDGHIFFRNESVGEIDIGLGEISCSQYLFEFDAAGAPVSNRCVHANDYTLLPGGGFAVAYQLFDPLTLGGETCTPNRENPSDTTDDALVARYGASGELIGKYCTADPGDQIIEGVLPAPGGMLFITGAYGPQLTLPGERVLEPVEPSSSSAMVARIAAP